MNKEEIKEIAIKGVKGLLNNIYEKKYDNFSKIHKKKVHFIPQNYRVFGAFLQSLNIQFGKYIEKFVCLLLESQNEIEIHSLTNKKISKQITDEEENFIGKYIRDKQENINKICIDDVLNFSSTNNVLDNVKRNKKLDIDLFFKYKNNYYYFEIKYADDHDSGKIENIPRKLLQTFFTLKKELNIKPIPAILYFDRKERYKNKYLEENKNVFRGEKFWMYFTNIKYADILDVFNEISESQELKEEFDNLRKKILN